MVAVSYLVRESAIGLGFVSGVLIVLTPPIRVRDVVVPVAGLVAVAVLAALAGLVLTVTAHQAGTGWPAFRGWALASVAVLGAVPRRCRHVRHPPCRRWRADS
jgi:peptidoglycan/LPS O-acetylase OafA/YrhL